MQHDMMLSYICNSLSYHWVTKPSPLRKHAFVDECSTCLAFSVTIMSLIPFTALAWYPTEEDELGRWHLVYYSMSDASKWLFPSPISAPNQTGTYWFVLPNFHRGGMV